MKEQLLCMACAKSSSIMQLCHCSASSTHLVWKKFNKLVLPSPNLCQSSSALLHSYSDQRWVYTQYTYTHVFLPNGLYTGFSETITQACNPSFSNAIKSYTSNGQLVTYSEESNNMIINTDQPLTIMQRNTFVPTVDTFFEGVYSFLLSKLNSQSYLV